MAQRSTGMVFVVLGAGMAWLACQQPAYAALCEAIVGQWAWFTGGVVTVRPDGTMVHAGGNDGTWQCTDAASGRFTLQWRGGNFVNHVALSADGGGLSSTDPAQSFVTATRLGAGGAAPSARGTSSSRMIVATQPDGARSLPTDLPELVQDTTRRARQWRPDAIPVALTFEHREAPNPSMRGPAVNVAFFSPALGTGLRVTVTTTGEHTSEFTQTVNWGTMALPPVFVDLPVAVRIARKKGMQGPVRRARLAIWSPSGAPPVLAWIIDNITVNGATGEIIDYDVTGYIARYQAQWEHAAKGLRALMRSARGASSGSGSPSLWGDGSTPGAGTDQPYDDGSAARQEHERRAAEGRAYWGGSAEDYNRIKNGQCTWSDASRFGC